MKITFELPEDDWHGYGSESMWAEDLGGGKYRLRNTPFAVYGFSFEDVVRAEELEGRLQVTSPVHRSGRSTYRIFLEKGLSVNDPVFESSWQPLRDLGCNLESATDRLIAVDVPPEADLARIRDLLDRGEASGVWDYEEGHRAAPLGK